VRDSFTDTHRPVVRADAGYFAAELAHTALGLGCDFAVAAKRNPALWRAAAGVPEHEWSAAHRMTGAQVAVCDYAPAGWPPGTYTIIRRVRIDAADISADPRSRRRRTIDRDQLALVLEGAAAHGWATSFIVTNMPTGGDGFDTATDVEAWFRMRTDIEDRIREAKLGAGLIHLPSVISSPPLPVHDVHEVVRERHGTVVDAITLPRPARRREWRCECSECSCRAWRPSRGPWSATTTSRSSRSSGSWPTWPRLNGHRTRSGPMPMI